MSADPVTLRAALLICAALLFSSVGSAQHINDSLLAQFYQRTLSDYFKRQSAFCTSATSSAAPLLISTAIPDSLLPAQIHSSQIQYVEHFNIAPHLPKRKKRHIGRSYLHISHQQLGKDTIDVLVAGYSVGIEKRSIVLSLWCRGTLGYIPDGRFVYHHHSHTWLFYGWQASAALKNEQTQRKLPRE